MTLTGWKHQNYLKEASNKLADKEVYFEVPNDPTALANAIFMTFKKIRSYGYLSEYTRNCF